MEIDTRIAGVTINVSVPVTAFRDAVIVSVPVPVLVASPIVGEESLTVATVAEEEVQNTEVVMSCIVPSVNVPVAVNGSVVPSGIDEAAAETAIETSAAGVTVRVADPLDDPVDALIVLVPFIRPLARPLALMVARLGLDDVQVTELVRSFVVPSLKVPVAVN